MSTFVRAVIHFIRRLSGKFILFGKSITKFVFGPDAHKIALALSVVLVVVYFVFMSKHLLLDLLELSLEGCRRLRRWLVALPREMIEKGN